MWVWECGGGKSSGWELPWAATGAGERIPLPLASVVSDMLLSWVVNSSCCRQPCQGERMQRRVSASLDKTWAKQEPRTRPVAVTAYPDGMDRTARRSAACTDPMHACIHRGFIVASVGHRGGAASLLTGLEGQTRASCSTQLDSDLHDTHAVLDIICIACHACIA